MVIAESFEKIHRSNLVGMSILPLQFLEGENADSLKLTGNETFNIKKEEDSLKVRQMFTVTTNDGKEFKAMSRLDTEVEVE